MVFAIQIRMDWKTQTVIGFGLRETSGPAQDGVKTTSAVFCHVTLVDGEATEVPDNLGIRPVWSWSNVGAMSCCPPKTRRCNVSRNETCLWLAGCGPGITENIKIKNVITSARARGGGSRDLNGIEFSRAYLHQIAESTAKQTGSRDWVTQGENWEARGTI
ncbi:hypothetical protein RRG08_050152 [Elysia crispata]|uniref:Uncharacterized protein n=1 Tax=Elysia crispata TaxID=231223 RepID=A0AAE1ACW0_9GAST|nr:hypothetical protein RRG08_050152 [Elysia crispata]